MISQLQKQIVDGQVNSLYIFTGPEIGIMDIYIQKIGETGKAGIERKSSLKDITDIIGVTNFLAKKTCYVVKNDGDILKQDERLWDNLKKGQFQGKHITILVYDKIDKRSKFYNYFKDIVVTFEKVGANVLMKYAMRKLPGLNPNYAYDLVHRADLDYNRMMMECDKLKNLAQAMNIDTDHAYKRMVQENQIYTSPQNVIFDFVDAICKRKEAKAFELLKELKEVGYSPIGVMSLLYSNFKNMYILNAGGEDPLKRLGVSQWQINRIKEKGLNYTLGELIYNIKRITLADKKVKSGAGDPDKILELLIINILT